MTSRIKLYNTATRSKDPFAPSGSTVGLYCCGPTVYDYAHIGNLRTYVFEDVLKRTLKMLGMEVRHVVNITDVGHLVSDEDTGEDKMEKGARREGKTVWEIASFYTAKFVENIDDLNIEPADIWPKATDHIGEMIELVAKLEQRGYTYTSGEGIYFDTSKFPRYGEFAGLEADALRAGTRVDMGDKRRPTDFALWKFSPVGVKRQMEWESPWGVGFPGWHIECSAMALKYLDQPLDIHCGGSDHIRVHHTNEIAQVEAATDKPFARFWVHGEFLVMDKGKMAKSSGSFVTLETVKERGIEPLAYRMMCFSAHYRNPLTFSWEALEGAARSLTNLRKLVAEQTGGESGRGMDGDAVSAATAPFREALCDDLNMPRAVGWLWEFLRDGSVEAGVKAAAVAAADEVLRLNLLDGSPRERVMEFGDEGGAIRIVSTSEVSRSTAEEIVENVRSRREARAGRDFAAADRIRDRLRAEGVSVKDLRDGTTECVVETGPSSTVTE